MPDIVLRRYTTENKNTWNDFIDEAKNATFLFNRDYMDYHADRFRDHSLMIYWKGKLEGVFVANEDRDTIYSHAGLTYGGLVLHPEIRLEEVAQFFFHILKYYHENSFTSIQYKCVPEYFAKLPSDEDQYVLFLVNAELMKREASCVFNYDEPLPYRDNRDKSIDDSKSKSYKIKVANDPAAFWTNVLEPNLRDRYGVKPVHSSEEMRLLMSRFSSNIKLYEVYDDELIGGAVIYETDNVAQAQYLSATPAGRKLGALDALLDHLIMNVYNEKKYFSLGTSNENEGRTLNRGLMSWKEGFGARIRVHDCYRIDTKNFALLAGYQ